MRLALPFSLGLLFGWISHPDLAAQINLVGYALFGGTAFSITALPISCWNLRHLRRFHARRPAARSSRLDPQSHRPRALEGTRFATGRKNYIEINGANGSIVWDLDQVNELQLQGKIIARCINASQATTPSPAPIDRPPRMPEPMPPAG